MSMTADNVFFGLFTAPKSLPTWLLYDELGCELYERITRLPEYYLTRAGIDVFLHRADDMIRHAADGGAPFALAEIGAGMATKTEILIVAALRRQPSCVYLACDIAPEPLAALAARLPDACPGVQVRTFAGTHLAAGPAIRALEQRQVLLFLGSSIGNYSDPEAIELLSGMRRFLRDDALLILGTDLKKDPRLLYAAYDDAEGVTAAFTLNVLTRLNREYGCDFRPSAFRHIAEWNEETSSIEISLEAQGAQRVSIGALGREVMFADRERVHLETSAKYDAARVDRILGAAGFTRVETFLDSAAQFGVQLARVTRR